MPFEFCPRIRIAVGGQVVGVGRLFDGCIVDYSGRFSGDTDDDIEILELIEDRLASGYSDATAQIANSTITIKWELVT